MIAFVDWRPDGGFGNDGLLKYVFRFGEVSGQLEGYVADVNEAGEELNMMYFGHDLIYLRVFEHVADKKIAADSKRVADEKNIPNKVFLIRLSSLCLGEKRVCMCMSIYQIRVFNPRLFL